MLYLVMRVLLTGASGFVGCAILEALGRQGAEVHAVSRRSPASSAPHIWHQADLLVPGVAESLAEDICADTIIHAAWIVDHGSFWSAPENLDWVYASLALLRAAHESGTRRFVGIGTCYEYDWPDNGDCKETGTSIRPHRLYAIAKDATRRASEGFSAEQGLEFVWARLFFLYGAGEHPNRVIPCFARAITRGDPAPDVDGNSVRDFMDVHDAGEAIAALAFSRFIGAINIGTGQGIKISELATKMERLAGRPGSIEFRKSGKPSNNPPRIVADVSRLREELGFEPTRTFDEGLRRVLTQWR